MYFIEEIYYLQRIFIRKAISRSECVNNFASGCRFPRRAFMGK